MKIILSFLAGISLVLLFILLGLRQANQVKPMDGDFLLGALVGCWLAGVFMFMFAQRIGEEVAEHFKRRYAPRELVEEHFQSRPWPKESSTAITNLERTKWT